MKIIHNNKEYPITVTRKRVRYLNLRIQKDGEIRISIPFNSSVDFVRNFLEEKDDRIRKMIEKIESTNLRDSELKKQYQNSFWYLGDKYNIQLVKNKEPNVDIIEDRIIISGPNPESKIERDVILGNFIVQNSVVIFERVITGLRSRFPELFPDRVAFKIKNYTSKWGTCYPFKNVVTLSLYLLHYDVKCIEYIVVHELAHFKHQNHGKEFHRLVESKIPDWKEYNVLLRNPDIKAGFINLKAIRNRCR